MLALRQAAEWRCKNPICLKPYSHLEIEELLIRRMQRLILRYQTQDLRCAKCASVRVDEFMEHCVCAGTWIESVKREDVWRDVGVLGGVARWWGLKMVEGVVGEVLSGF